jgi:transposase InsO family protein
MKTHRSAKTNVYQRQLLIRRVRQQGWTQREAAAAAGVSVRTVAKWLTRKRTELDDRSSRPHRHPRRLAATTEAAIVALRRTRATAWQISTALGMPRSTVTRVLARRGLNRVALLEPAAPVQRYEWSGAGDLLHVDLKRLGRIAGIGHRIHGDRRARVRGIGWEFLHVAVDDATRLAYVEVLQAEDKTACAAFLQRAFRWYRRRGIRIRRLLTDNAMAYRAHIFARACRTWAVRQRFTRPYHPQTNGKAERLIQTLLREWAYRFPYRSSARRTAALAPYLRFYNHRRPHASLGRRSPWTRFQEAA